MPEAMDPSPLELKSQEVVSCHVWLLGPKLCPLQECSKLLAPMQSLMPAF